MLINHGLIAGSSHRFCSTLTCWCVDETKVTCLPVRGAGLSPDQLLTLIQMLDGGTVVSKQAASMNSKTYLRTPISDLIWP